MTATKPDNLVPEFSSENRLVEMRGPTLKSCSLTSTHIYRDACASTPTTLNGIKGRSVEGEEEETGAGEMERRRKIGKKKGEEN